VTNPFGHIASLIADNYGYYSSNSESPVTPIVVFMRNNIPVMSVNVPLRHDKNKSSYLLYQVRLLKLLCARLSLNLAALQILIYVFVYEYED